MFTGQCGTASNLLAHLRNTTHSAAPQDNIQRFSAANNQSAGVQQSDNSRQHRRPKEPSTAPAVASPARPLSSAPASSASTRSARTGRAPAGTDAPSLDELTTAAPHRLQLAHPCAGTLCGLWHAWPCTALPCPAQSCPPCACDDMALRVQGSKLPLPSPARVWQPWILEPGGLGARLPVKVKEGKAVEVKGPKLLRVPVR